MKQVHEKILYRFNSDNFNKERFPGAFIVWLVTGFKYKLGNIAREKGETAKEWTSKYT